MSELIINGPQNYDEVTAYIKETGELEFWKAEGDKRLYKYRTTLNGVTMSLSCWVGKLMLGADRQAILDLMQKAHKIRVEILGPNA